MRNALLISLIGANVGICIRNGPLGIGVYILLAFLTPNLIVVDFAITFEIAAFIPCAIAVLFKARRLALHRSHVLLWAYLVVFMLAMFVASVNGQEVSWLGLAGYLRFGIVLSLAMGNLQRQLIRRVVLGVIVVNAACAVLQMVVPESIDVFNDLYSKDSSTPLRVYAELGRFVRATGTFPSPVNLGVFALLGFALFYARFL